MRKHSICLASVLAAGTAALLISAPIASADDPPPCAPDDHQCLDQQQQQGAGIANQVIDNVQQGVDQAKQANEALNPSSADGLGIMVNLNGVPYCMPLNKPLPPGAVVTSPTGNGVSSWC
jgi:hypothetical protein